MFECVYFIFHDRQRVFKHTYTVRLLFDTAILATQSRFQVCMYVWMYETYIHALEAFKHTYTLESFKHTYIHTENSPVALI